MWTHTYPAEYWNELHDGGTLTTPTLDGDTLYTSNREGKGIESLPSETSVAKTNIYAELDEEGARLAEQIIRENLPQSK